MHCKAVVVPEPHSLSFLGSRPNSNLAFATCPDCHRGISKLVGTVLRAHLEACIKTNTPLGSIDEDDSHLPTAIVRKAGQSCLVWNAGNERAIWEFQSYLGRYHPRTIDAVLASIRHLESALIASHSID
jgi:hypothetical protein